MAIEVFYSDRINIIEDDRSAYGEQRFIAFAAFENVALAVVYTERDEVIRIISARKQSRKERRQWR